MEEQILKIMGNHFTSWDDSDTQTAKEITLMVMEFIEWVGLMFDEIWWNKYHNIWKWHTFSENTENVSEYSTSQLFQYWFNNIKNKKS